MDLLNVWPGANACLRTWEPYPYGSGTGKQGYDAMRRTVLTFRAAFVAHESLLQIS